MITNYHTRDHSNGNPQNIVIILHGYGSDGANLLDLSDIFAPFFQNPVFIAPDAPFPYEYVPDMGRQWFSLLDRNEEVLLEGAEIARKILLQFIDIKLKEYNLKNHNLTFIGFSQGTMIALYTALKLEEKCRAVVGFSGTIVSAEETISSCKSKPPICMIHGSDDDVVPCTLGKFTAKILKENKISTEFYEIPNLGHSIEMQGIKHAQKFLKTV